MAQAYKISWMTCKGWVDVVRNLLSKVQGVKRVDVNLSDHHANIDMKKYIPCSVLKEALGETVYQLSEGTDSAKLEFENEMNEPQKLVSDYIIAAGQKDYGSYF